MGLKELKNQFLEHLEIEKNRSKKTIENYNHYLNRFIDFAKAGSPSDIDIEVIRKYRLHLNRTQDKFGKSLKRVTQNYHIIALRAFLKYLAKRDIHTIPAEKVELGKQEEREVTFLENNEVQRLLSTPKTANLAGLRDKAILETLFSTGLRISELCGLNRDEINFEAGEFSVKGKGGKSRIIFLSDNATAVIKNYLGARKDADLALFIRVPLNEKFEKYDNLRLTPRSVQRGIKK